jgi:hypothetical protein
MTMARPNEPTTEREVLDPAVRAAEKQASREADARAIRSSEKTIEQLRRENSFTALVDFAPIDYSKLPRARVR